MSELVESFIITTDGTRLDRGQAELTVENIYRMRCNQLGEAAILSLRASINGGELQQVHKMHQGNLNNGLDSRLFPNVPAVLTPRADIPPATVLAVLRNMIFVEDDVVELREPFRDTLVLDDLFERYKNMKSGDSSTNPNFAA